MGGSSDKVTVGYRYYLGVHMILCHGPVDKVVRFQVDGRTAWLGNCTGGRVDVNVPSLFGGESREGGVSGAVDIEMGYPDQPRNDYLQARLGPDIPAYRGVVGAVLRQVYMGLNPYLKPWSFRAQRVYVRQDGIAQWYPEKAGINKMTLLDPTSANWRYLITDLEDTADYSSPSFDDSAWLQGATPFSGGGAHPYSEEVGFPAIQNTFWPINSKLWLRNDFVSFDGGPVTFEIFVDNLASAWINGTQILDRQGTIETPSGEVFNHRVEVPGSLVKAGINNIVIMAEDVGFYSYAACFLLGQSGSESEDMNPAHIIRECLTDPDWGMGYQESDIDDVSFAAAADTLWSEGMGISILWDREAAIMDFVQEILRHIDAALYVDRNTGKFSIKLIRGDYDPEALPVFDESNIKSMESYKRRAFGELVNAVTVNYWDSRTGKTASLQVQDTALIQGQGAVISQTVAYPGFTNANTGSRAAQRDLRALSSPLLSCTFVANRDAESLDIGSAFRLGWSDYHDGHIIMRVAGLTYGDGTDNTVRVECTQDVFGMPVAALTVPDVDEWEDPSQPPAPASHRAVFEAPYYELVQRLGQIAVDQLLAEAPDSGYLLASAARPEGGISARLMVDAGAGYEERGGVEFSPTAWLSEGVGKSDTVLPVVDGESLDDIRIGSVLQIGDELVRVDAVSESEIEVGRGVLDTVPQDHPVGTRLMAWDDFAEGDGVEYVAPEDISVKLLPVSGAGEVALVDAVADTLTMSSRAIRPFPPGNFRLGGEPYPATILGDQEAVVTWSHRDRTQQTSGEVQDTSAGNIGPEVGTTYTLRVYGEQDELGREVTGISGSSYAYTHEMEQGDFEYPAEEAPEDPIWDSVVLLGHMDGPADSTSFTDVSNDPVTLTRGGANPPLIKTDQSQFGGASGYFDGTGWIELSELTRWNFGSGDFTIEAWIRPATVSGVQMIFARQSDAGSSALALQLRLNGNKLESVMRGGTSTAYTTTGTTSLSANNWYHVAVTRASGAVRLFVNGAFDAGPQAVSAALDDATYYPRIGVLKVGNLPPQNFFTGHIDEVRITKGIALYTAAFVPPGAAFPEGGVGAAGRLSGRLRFELESVRDGYTSYQAHNHTVKRVGYGFNYGEFYGGE